ncbi:MAG: ethanolamine ammonia-lyase subunit EutC [Deltaproteobacteria bacterium]|nr:ethanolamine ammonia-lyase subunit EutC [Deltaproteobacteria bacterium]
MSGKSAAIDSSELEAVVRAVLAQLGNQPGPAAVAAAAAAAIAPRAPLAPGERSIPELVIESPQERGEVAEPAAGAASKPKESALPADWRFRRPRNAADGVPFRMSELATMRGATPARIVQGRVGTRYPTDKAIGLRAEHAVALDAVHSALPEGFAAELGCVELWTQAEDHAEYLAFPDKGRALHPESRAKLEAEGSRGADVQIIAGDGLAAWALTANGPALLPALQAELTAAGFSLGKPLLVHRARIGVQDEIGVVLGCKATVILVGERPGLGTGDSLSIYTAYGPKLGQDNAEKDCISNIRPLGIPADEAAKLCTELLKRTFAAGGGGVKLTSAGAE